MPPRHQEALPAHWGSWTGCLSDAGSPPSLPPPASPGLERDKFDNKTVSFEEHIKFEHNMWNYLYFIVLVRVKNKTDYTGPESYVAQMIKVRAWGATGGGDGCGPLFRGSRGRGAGAGSSGAPHPTVLQRGPLEKASRGCRWCLGPMDARCQATLLVGTALWPFLRGLFCWR